MFNHHKRLLKQVRAVKKANTNKERNEDRISVGTAAGCFLHDISTWQAHIEKTTGLKIHKNNLRGYRMGGDYTEDTDAERTDGGRRSRQPRKMADPSVPTLGDIKAILDVNRLPKPEYTHDKTHWRRAKKHDKKLQLSRKLKTADLQF